MSLSRSVRAPAWKQRASLARHQTRQHLSLGIPAFRSKRETLLLFLSQPVYGILLEQHRCAKTEHCWDRYTVSLERTIPLDWHLPLQYSANIQSYHTNLEMDRAIFFNRLVLIAFGTCQRRSVNSRRKERHKCFDHSMSRISAIRSVHSALNRTLPACNNTAPCIVM